MTTDSIPLYYRYWGKAEKDGSLYHLLPYHSLDVAAVGHLLLNNPVLLSKFSTITGIEAKICLHWLIMFLALHDIGKFSETFQNLRPDLLELLQDKKSNKDYTVRHDSLGNLFLKSYFNKEKIVFPDRSDVIFDEWQDVIMAIVRSYTGHHGLPPQMKGQNGMPLNFSRYFCEEDYVAAAKFIQDVVAIVCFPDNTLTLPSLYTLEESTKRASWLMAGFAVLCDWIGSNTEWFKFCPEPMKIDEYWETIAIPQAKIAIRASGINSGTPLKELPVFSELFPLISSPSPLQNFVSQCRLENCPQLFILEDVTGSGKTEAALLLAARLMATGCGKGFFVALPTMATSNAIYDRLAEIYKKLFLKESFPSLVLTHGARHLSEDFLSSLIRKVPNASDAESATVQCSSWLADNRKKALLADVGVGTIDQALLAVLPARFQSLRLFGLANQILIVDEVHAYDPYMNKLLQNLLTFHASLGGSVILLSATLPTHIRQNFIASFALGCGDHQELKQRSQAYPLASVYTPKTGINETSIETNRLRCCEIAVRNLENLDEVVQQIVETANKGNCVCWLRNTVHDVLVGYESLKGRVEENNLMLFHSRFTVGDRLDIESKVNKIFGKKSTGKERRGKVLIATQVVEQSLDLDFDLLVSDLAPMDLLIQRAGRLHRHTRDEQGNPSAAKHDKREPPHLIIHGPLPEDNPDSNWYKSAFPKAAFVYPSHGCLWLTSRLLIDKKALKMPDDARELIESTFSECADRIPLPLLQRDQQAEAKWQADKTLAHINMLKLDEGYEATVTQWREDMKTPTRLGVMETSVRLACWDGVNINPWYPHKKYPWDMSQVNIRSSLVHAEIIHDGAFGEKIKQIKECLPDKGKWTITVVLQQNEYGCWRGEALNIKSEIMVIEYNRVTGVTIRKKED